MRKRLLLPLSCHLNANCVTKVCFGAKQAGFSTCGKYIKMCTTLPTFRLSLGRDGTLRKVDCWLSPKSKSLGSATMETSMLPSKKDCLCVPSKQSSVIESSFSTMGYERRCLLVQSLPQHWLISCTTLRSQLLLSNYRLRNVLVLLPNHQDSDSSNTLCLDNEYINLVAIPDHTGNASSTVLINSAQRLPNAIVSDRGLIQCNNEFQWFLLQGTAGITNPIKVQSFIDDELNKRYSALPSKAKMNRVKTGIQRNESK